MRHERSRLRTWIAALLSLIVGGVLLLLSEQLTGRWYTGLLGDFGSLVVVSVGLILVFEHWQREAFVADLLKSARVAEQLERSGISGFFDSFHEGVDWDDIFKRSSKLDIVFAYGSTWRNTHALRLERLLAKDDGRVRVVLPRSASSPIIAELAMRFGLTELELQRRIQEARDYFGGLAQRFPGKVEAFEVSRSLTYSAYCFDTDALLVLYNLREGRHAVPTFVCRRGGALYEFLRIEFKGMLGAGSGDGPASRIAFDVRALPAASPTS
jgi:hypothetical protein